MNSIAPHQPLRVFRRLLRSLSDSQCCRVRSWDLMRGRGTLAYAAFDLLWLNGRDLRSQPLTRRKKSLERLIPTSAGPLNRMPCFEKDGRSCLKRPVDWTWRGSWRSGSAILTAPRRRGTRSRTRPILSPKGDASCLSGCDDLGTHHC